jgi:hypothetical protein
MRAKTKKQPETKPETKHAICMATGGRKSTVAVSLYAISALRELEGTTVYIRDGDEDPLWNDDACHSALNAIATRTNLQYRRGKMTGIGTDRWELVGEAMQNHDAVLLLDDDAILPESFLLRSKTNLQNAAPDWGFIGHFGIDTLQLGAPGMKAALSGAASGLQTHYSWQAVGESQNGLAPAYSVCGFCAWYRSAALQVIDEPMRQMVNELHQGEDGGLSMMLSSRFPCYVADAPMVRHYRNVNKRTSKEGLVLATQDALHKELVNLGTVDEKRMKWLQDLMGCSNKR